jgi:hypothetical protein
MQGLGPVIRVVERMKTEMKAPRLVVPTDPKHTAKLTKRWFGHPRVNVASFFGQPRPQPHRASVIYAEEALAWKTFPQRR